MEIESNKRLFLVLTIVAIFLWMLLIFNLSSQPAEKSNKLSKGVTKVIVESVGKVVPNVDFNISRFNNFIRKNAHFFTFLVLGILVFNALKLSGIENKKCILLTLCICTLYGISDEIHQMFVHGRGAQVKDVVIDVAGSVVGVMLVKDRGINKIKFIPIGNNSSTKE